MYRHSGKIIVAGLASHIEDRFRVDFKTGLSLIHTNFTRLETSKKFIQHFVGREYCRGSTVFNCFKGDGVFPDPEDNSTFYICNNNVSIKERCPSGTEFSLTHFSCVATGDSNEKD